MCETRKDAILIKRQNWLFYLTKYQHVFLLITILSSLPNVYRNQWIRHQGWKKPSQKKRLNQEKTLFS